MKCTHIKGILYKIYSLWTHWWQKRSSCIYMIFCVIWLLPQTEISVYNIIDIAQLIFVLLKSSWSLNSRLYIIIKNVCYTTICITCIEKNFKLDYLKSWIFNFSFLFFFFLTKILINDQDIGFLQWRVKHGRSYPTCQQFYVIGRYQAELYRTRRRLQINM